MLVSGRAFRIVRFESSGWTSHACARRSAGIKHRCTPRIWPFHPSFFQDVLPKVEVSIDFFSQKRSWKNIGECAWDDFLPKMRYGQSSKEGPTHHLVFVWLMFGWWFFMGSTVLPCVNDHVAATFGEASLSPRVRSFWWHSGPLGTQNSP